MVEEVIGAAVETAVEMVVDGGGATSATGSGQGPRERSRGGACDVEEARSHHDEEEDRQGRSRAIGGAHQRRDRAVQNVIVLGAHGPSDRAAQNVIVWSVFDDKIQF
jgi:hypothetical protein